MGRRPRFTKEEENKLAQERPWIVDLNYEIIHGIHYSRVECVDCHKRNSIQKLRALQINEYRCQKCSKMAISKNDLYTKIGAKTDEEANYIIKAQYPHIKILFYDKDKHGNQRSLIECPMCHKLHPTRVWLAIQGMSILCNTCAFEICSKCSPSYVNKHMPGELIDGILLLENYGDDRGKFQCNFCPNTYDSKIGRPAFSCGCTAPANLGGTSRGAIICNRLLFAYGIQYTKEYWFPDLRTDKGYPVRFDYRIEIPFELGKSYPFILLEYQGPQHYKAVSDTGVYKDFGKLQREVTDLLKRQYCAEHGIKLYEIGYKEDPEFAISQILIKEGLLKLLPTPSDTTKRRFYDILGA